MIADAVGVRGELVFDSSKADGTPQKLPYVSRLMVLGWHQRVHFVLAWSRHANSVFLNRALRRNLRKLVDLLDSRVAGVTVRSAG